jgi:YVTN family beta-propeller protein
VTNGDSNRVSVINLATNTVINSIPVGTTPRGITISPDGKRAYVANSDSDNVTVIDTMNNNVLSTVPVGDFPVAIAITPDNARAYVTDYLSNTVSVINTATNTVTATIPVGDGPELVAITPDGTRAYVPNIKSRNVSVINTATNTVITNITTGDGPFGVVITSDGTRAYVTNYFSNNVSVIDTASNTVIATVSGIEFPFGIAITPSAPKIVPTITSVSPNSRATGSGTFELVVTGSNFLTNSVVRWNGQDRVTTFISATELRAQILASDILTAGQYAVTVFSPAPGGGLSNAINFTVFSCTYALNPTSQNFTARGGTGVTNVVTASGCAWTATSDASWITITAGATGSGNGTITFSVAANTGVERSGTITIGGQVFFVSQAAGSISTPRRTLFDFDGDGRADVSVFRPSDGMWYLLNSSTGFTASQFGVSTDKLAPADFDGDGKTDIAVYRATP